jgi:hypothetical protein
MDTYPANTPTLIVAVYAAVVATVTGIVQFLNFRRDRDKIKLTARRNMGISGDPRYEDMTLLIVTVANHGRRPVTITSVGAECLFPSQHFVFLDNNPRLPYELTEGKSLTAQTTQEGLDFNIIQCWWATDAVGRTHRLNVAPWYKRRLSKFRQKRKWKQEKKAKWTAV